VSLLEACRTRGIPVQASGQNQQLRRLGHGAKQRRMLGFQTDATAATSMALAADVSALRHTLDFLGINYVDADDAEEGMTQYRLYLVAGRLVAAVAAEQANTEVTSLVHTSIVSQIVELVRTFGLATAAVTITTRDIAQPLAQADGGITAVDPSPSLPDGCEAELARRLADAVLESAFPAGATARIPIVAVTGVNGKTTTTRMIAHILGVTGRPVGMTCTDGIFVGGERVASGDCAGPQSARNVLSHPRVEAAVLETARGGILREGVGFDRCDVAVVTNIGEGDHLGLGDIATVEQLASVKRTIVEAVGPNGTAALNAEDPLVLAMAPSCPGSIILFAVDAAIEAIASWRQGGGRAVVVRDGAIAVAEGEREFPLLSLDRIPLTHQGRIRFQVENVLAAVAATWSLGIPVEVIRTGLETFVPSADLVPARFNLLNVGGAAVVIDYGHNATALRAILESLQQFPHERRLCVYSAAGDRRNEDLIQQGKMIGDAFDQVVLYEDYYMRGRQPGEIIGLFEQGLKQGNRAQQWRGVQGWTAALEAALQWLKPGDLALIQADTIDSAVAYLKDHLVTQPMTREVTLKEVLASDQPVASAPRGTQVEPAPAVGTAAVVENRVLTHP
jgi:cyanophycin synthetase